MSFTDSVHERVNTMPRLPHDEAMALHEPRLIFMVDPDGHLGGFPNGRLIYHFINPLNKVSRDVSFMPQAWIVSDGNLVGVVCSFDSQCQGEDIRNILQELPYLSILTDNGIASVDAIGLPQPYKPVKQKLPQFKFNPIDPK